MKNLKKLMFGLAALLLAFGLVFTVSAFNAKPELQTAWFLLDENTGNLDPSHTQVDPDELCEESGPKYCAREYEVVDDEPISPTSSPIRTKQ